MWLAMRGALSEGARKIHQNYYLPMTAAMAVALFEEPVSAADASARDQATSGFSGAND
jgi:formaldehyde-activating enzyme involved in methanogenesis